MWAVDGKQNLFGVALLKHNHHLTLFTLKLILALYECMVEPCNNFYAVVLCNGIVVTSMHNLVILCSGIV